MTEVRRSTGPVPASFTSSLNQEISDKLKVQFALQVRLKESPSFMVPFPFSLVTESFSALENFRNVSFQLLSHLFEYVLCINYENFLHTRSNHYRISLTCDLNGHTRRSSPFLLRIISYKPEPVLSRMRVINVPDLQCAVVFFVTDVNEFISADGFIVAVINIRWLITIARIFTPKHFSHCTTGICISTGERDC